MARSTAGIELLVQGLERVAVVCLEQTEPYLRAQRSSRCRCPRIEGPEVEALRRAVLELTARRARARPPRRRREHRPACGPGPRPAGSRLLDRLDAQCGRAEGAGPARSFHPARGPSAAAWLPDSRAADARAAAKDREPGPERDGSGAERVSAPPAAPGYPGRAGGDQSRKSRGSRSCATA